MPIKLGERVGQTRADGGDEGTINPRLFADASTSFLDWEGPAEQARQGSAF